MQGPAHASHVATRRELKGEALPEDASQPPSSFPPPALLDLAAYELVQLHSRQRVTDLRREEEQQGGWEGERCGNLLSGAERRRKPRDSGVALQARSAVRLSLTLQPSHIPSKTLAGLRQRPWSSGQWGSSQPAPSRHRWRDRNMA